MRVVTAFPAIESLGGDAEIPTGESGVVAMRVIVVKPLEPLPGSLRQRNRDASQAFCTRYDAAIYAHNAAIIVPSHLSSSVTYPSERDHIWSDFPSRSASLFRRHLPNATAY